MVAGTSSTPCFNSMSSNSKIQWTDHTISFWWGCAKVSEACRYCYAETVAKVFGGRLFGGRAPEWGIGKPRAPRLEQAVKEAAKMQRRALKARLKAQESGQHPPRTLVFVNSMSDWLDDEVPTFWLATLLQTLATCPDLTFQLLTKRPENFHRRLLDVIEDSTTHAAEVWPHGGADVASFWLATSPPKNVWIGTTVEDQKAADKRIPMILDIPAAVRFLSCEPLLTEICLGKWLDDSNGIPRDMPFDWVIAGGESGSKARASHPAWFYSLRDQCTAAGVPFFFKQWGEWLPSGPEAAHLPENKTFKPDRFKDGLILLRTGTELAGRQLQGREWNEFPAMS